MLEPRLFEILALYKGVVCAVVGSKISKSLQSFAPLYDGTKVQLLLCYKKRILDGLGFSIYFTL